MRKQLIKICGLQDSALATKAAHAGADFIGLVFHPASPRHVSLTQATLIAAAAKKSGASPVAVFVDQTHDAMQAICTASGIHIVQLHGDTARAQHHLLPQDYRRIYVLNVSDQGELRTDADLHSLKPERDWILIDHAEPGTGQSINASQLRYSLPFPWFLAGGLTAKNVAGMIDQLQPQGVDVSSGVEIATGLKTLGLIQQFITAVRGSNES